MLAVVADPSAAQPRRDQMAIASAPYCHPRLGIQATVDRTSGGDAGRGGPVSITILSIPRGAQFNASTCQISYDGGDLETPVPPFVPFQPSPALPTMYDALPPPAEPEPPPVYEPELFEVAEPEPPANVTRLDSFVRRRSDDDGSEGT
jgi:hypothetical protein